MLLLPLSSPSVKVPVFTIFYLLRWFADSPLAPTNRLDDFLFFLVSSSATPPPPSPLLSRICSPFEMAVPIAFFFFFDGARAVRCCGRRKWISCTTSLGFFGCFFFLWLSFWFISICSVKEKNKIKSKVKKEKKREGRRGTLKIREESKGTRRERERERDGGWDRRACDGGGKMSTLTSL